MSEKVRSMEEIRAQVERNFNLKNAQINDTAVKKSPIVENENPLKEEDSNRGSSAALAMEKILRNTVVPDVNTDVKSKEKGFGEVPTFVFNISSLLVSVIRSVLVILVGAPIISIIDLVKDIKEKTNKK